MSAPLGNRNSEKYSLENTEIILRRIMEHSLSDDVILLNQSLIYVNLYPEAWSYLKRKWQDNEEIYDRMRIIETYFENKMVLGACSGAIRNGIAQLVLKTKYGYTDYRSDREEIIQQAEEIATLRQQLEKTTKELNQAKSKIPPPPPRIKTTPAINAGRFHLEIEGHQGGEFIFMNHRHVEVLRVPHTSARQFIDMGDPDAGQYTIYLVGAGFMIEGGLCVEDRRYQDRIPEVNPD